MPVKKLGSPVHSIRAAARKAVPVETSEYALPDAPKPKNVNLGDYLILIYGREKIGKTTLFASFPEAIFFATEPGTKGLEVYEFNHDKGGVKDWGVFRAGVKLLVDNPGKFKTVIIDTVDRAYDMCLDWVCTNRGIEYPGKDAAGDEDFGKSWHAVRQEFIEQLHALSHAGYGICFSSHVKEMEFKNKFTGDKYWKVTPSISNQGRKVIEAIVDLFFYAEYVTGADGLTRRVLFCQGDESIWAGARETCAVDFPAFLPLEKNGYEIIQQAFLGEDVGLNPAEFRPGRGTTNTGKTFLQKAKLKSVQK